jgi:hypothetical protein
MADYIDDFIKVGKLKEELNKLDDEDYICVTTSHRSPNFKIAGIVDSTCIGFWEIRINFP